MLILVSKLNPVQKGKIGNNIAFLKKFSLQRFLLFISLFFFVIDHCSYLNCYQYECSFWIIVREILCA